MKSYLKVLPVAILFALYSYYHDRSSSNQRSHSIQVGNSPVNKNVHPTKPSNNNYSPPQQQVESVLANPNQQVDEGQELAQNIIGHIIKNGTKCDDYANAQRHCSPAGNFDKCMSYTIGNNFKQIEADCAEAERNIFKR